MHDNIKITLHNLQSQSKSFKDLLDLLFPIHKDEANNENIANLPNEIFDFANAIIFYSNAKNDDKLESSKSGHSNLAFSLVPTHSHKRADLIHATYEINKAITSYNIIFFVSFTHLSIAFATRRDNKITSTKDVLEKITLIKDINLANPSHAHRKNLDQIAKIKPKEVDIYYSEILEALSISSLNKAFYTEIFAHFAHFVENLTLPNTSDEQTKRDFVLRLFSRILFCKFLEKKSIVDSAIWDTNLSQNYYHEVLEPLFFTTLNTPRESRNYGFLSEQIISLLHAIPYLNGGLFSPQDNDFFDLQNPNALINSLHISNDLFSELFATLNRYHFTIDEADESAVEVALDPELLGQIFESLLSQLFTDNKLEKLDKNTLRKATGSYYTPREIVRYMVKSAILLHLQTKLKGKVDSTNLHSIVFGNFFHHRKKIISPSRRGARGWVDSSLRDLPTASRGNPHPKDLILQELATLKILDPACGSGAFPMGILNEIIRIQGYLGDTRPLYTRKLEILQECIYGIDIQPMATEIARLRCFLSLIIDENPSDIKPLPNLEFKFISANALLPLPKNKSLQYDGYVRDMAELDKLRTKYFNPDSTISKAQIQKSYTTLRTKIANKVSATNAQEALDNPLLGYDPFNPHSAAQFFDSEYMFGVESFDIVIGNPPYIRQESIPNKQAITQSYKNINFLGKDYAFSCSTADIYTYFFAKGAMLLSPKGNLIFITSNKFCRAGYGKNLREFLLGITIQKYVDFNGVKVFENATVDSCILQICKERQKDNMIAYATPTQKDLSTLSYSQIPQDSLNSEAFIFVDSPTLALKQKIEQVGTPLKEWDIAIYRGVLTGYNEAFIIDTQTKEAILDSCDNSIKSPLPCGGGLGVGLTERERTEQLIKPILRGRDIKRYSYEWAGLWLIGTHNGYTSQNGEQIPAIDINDYPALKKHLDSFYPKLEKRADKGKTPYNLRNCAYLEDFEKEILVWKAVGRNMAFSITQKGVYLTAPASFISANLNVLKYLLGILHSKTLQYIIYQRADTTGAGDLMLNNQSLERLPIPKITKENQNLADEIINLVDKILALKAQNSSADTSQLEKDIDNLVFKLYDLNEADISKIKF